MSTVAQLKDVHKVYRAGEVEVHAVRGVTLDIEEGAFLSIAGPSGSGKTTALNLLGALDTPTRGEITVGEMSLTGLEDKVLADFRNTHLGFIFQTFNLIPVLTVYENVEFPLHLKGVRDAGERRRRVEKTLEDVGLGGMGDRRPAELSGGQQQRVAIARALVKDPTLVLADEPTANVDSDTSREIIAVMQELNEKRGTTFVFSTHDPLVMEHATRLVRLRDGQVESDTGPMTPDQAKEEAAAEKKEGP
ncbi:MAG: ABC transporter ATP-binding protein [bacterium]